MAEDVKVKFSGDFSEVSKGADSAAKTAGTAMKGWADDLGKTMLGAVASIFAADALIGKFMGGLSEAREYFLKLNDAIDETGISAEELQKIVKLGKNVGVSMESTVKSIGLFSKYMGNASRDANAHGKTLRELGFSNEQITGGTIGVTEVLAALADQLEKTGNDYQMAAYSSEIFGRSGRELIQIIRQGREAIENAADGTKIYTQAELDLIEASERRWQKRNNTIKGFFRELWRDIADDTSTIFAEALDSVDAKIEKMGGRVKEMKAETAPDNAYNRMLREELKSKGISLETQKQMFSPLSKENPGGGWAAQNPQFLNDLNKAIQEEKNKKKEEITSGSGLASIAAMSSSSLQAIGGGDISSVLAGTTPVDQIAENTRQSTYYLKSIAESNPAATVDGAAAH
jgi:hypothetical protein